MMEYELQASPRRTNDQINASVGLGTAYGTWTPTFTCATVGDLSFTYNLQLGWYVKLGEFVLASFFINLIDFTYATASGDIIFGGLPYNTGTVAIGYGPLEFQGITKANYTQFVPFTATASSPTFRLRACGSGQGLVQVNISDLPSGGSPRFHGQLFYSTIN